MSYSKQNYFGSDDEASGIKLMLPFSSKLFVNRCGLAVKRYAGKQKDLGSIRFGSPLSSKMVVYVHCLVTLPTQLMKH